MKHILEYVLKNFFLFYPSAEKEIQIQYGNEINGENKVLIKQSADGTVFNGREDISADKIARREWKGTMIPFCFDTSSEMEIISEEGGKVIINYDIIASSFYFLSGWNELVSGVKDEYGRVSYDSSIIKKLNIINIPVVNYYFDILKTAIEKAYGKKAEDNVWGKFDFAVSLTHDIDNCKSAWLEGSFSELKKGKLISIPQLIYKRFFSRDEWFNFRTISDIEKKYNATSSFYFLPRKGKTNNLKNSDYEITSSEIQEEIKYLKDEGHDIGVHGSFGSHLNFVLFNEDIKRINSKEIAGNRFHFLMFDVLKTVSILESSNIKYDTSLGFAEQTGFRRGTCFPFYLYNFEEERISGILETPLIVMDATLRNIYNIDSNRDELISEIEILVKEIKKWNGVFTLLWHNNYFSDYKFKGWREMYIYILEICRNENALITNCNFIYKSIVKK